MKKKKNPIHSIHVLSSISNQMSFFFCPHVLHGVYKQYRFKGSVEEIMAPKILFGVKDINELSFVQY